MSGPTLRSLHAALRQSHRRISVRSLQPAWTQEPGESFRCLREGGATTSWNRNRSMATGQPRLPSLLAQIQTQTQTQSQSQALAQAQARLGQRTEQSRGYATLPALAVPLASILQEMSAAAAPSQPSVYATVHIYGRPYLVTAGDRLRLPFRMAGVQPGDILHLDRVGVVGSRSVTAVGGGGGGGSGPEGEGVQHGGHVPGVSVTAVVLGLEAEPLRVLVKKKRRNRRKRTVRSKHQYTVLRIQDVHLGEEST